MLIDWRPVVERFPEVKVVVLGETMLDCYVRGTTNRVCREAPVPIVAVSTVDESPGGAANVAANLAALGAKVTFISVRGDDRAGRHTQRLLVERGIDCDGMIEQSGRVTLTKQRIIAGSQMLLRFDEGDIDNAAPNVEASVIDALIRAWAEADAIVVSDYGYGVVTPSVLEALRQLQAWQKRPLFVDAKDLPAYIATKPCAVKPNYAEAASLLGVEPVTGSEARRRQMASLSETLLKRTGSESAIVTLDEDGCVVLRAGEEAHLARAPHLPRARAAGAGDSFLAAYALASACRAEATAAAELACWAAALAIREDGTAVCTGADLTAHLATAERHVLAREEAALVLEDREGPDVASSSPTAASTSCTRATRASCDKRALSVIFW